MIELAFFFFYYLCDTFFKSCARHVIRDWEMRKLLLFFSLAAVLGITSCMDTKYVTKKSTFDQTLSRVQENMAQQGFKLTGSSTETKNDLLVLGTSYTERGGYGTELANNYVTRDTYRFTNASGHTASYTVSYLLRGTKKGLPYIDAAEVAGCEVSDPADYELICGANSPIYQINSMEKDQAVKVGNSTKTLLLVSGVTIGALILLLLGLE